MTKPKPVPDPYPGMVICSNQDCRDWAVRVKKPHKHRPI